MEKEMKGSTKRARNKKIQANAEANSKIRAAKRRLEKGEATLAYHRLLQRA
jgi:hypothetical protein